ncbi:MAG: hypothetical protein JW795_03425 [Chitinivibrionales bacterium]|nr:hypothetical protein [Chitinivibrionales bacterium]
MSLLNIEQKKGKPDNLDGRLTVYAIVNIDPGELLSSNNPIVSMIHNGLLAAQGNYRDQNSLKDFIQTEFGQSLEEGLEEFISKLDGLESALDPQKLRDKLKNLDELKDFMPTPAKLVPFHSESEILDQEGDVFFIGSFKSSANANLSVSSFAIFYQALFREQEVDRIRTEIDQLISQIENPEVTVQTTPTPAAGAKSIEETLISSTIPSLLYCRKDTHSFEEETRKLRSFLHGYQCTDDIDKIVSIIKKNEVLSKDHYKLLELYARKIDRVSVENFNAVETLVREIAAIENRL